MTISSEFTIDGALPTGAVAVAPGATVILALVSADGVSGIEWSVVGNDHPTRVDPAIIMSGSPQGATASFTMPADTGDLGQSYRIQCTVSDGKRAPAKSTTVRIVGVVNSVGVVPFAAGEEFDRGAGYGWTAALNLAMTKLLPVIVSLYATSQRPILAVDPADGWEVVGSFRAPVTTTIALDVTACVSDPSLTLTARMYCVTDGFVGAVTDSEVSITSTVDDQDTSSSFTIAIGRMYQIQAKVSGNQGDNYFGYVRRAAPAVSP